MLKFNEAIQENLSKLEQYVPVVARVHGGTHPIFFEVQKVYNTINTKIKKAGREKPEIADELKQLRELTNNYNVPNDVCESYEAVYEMLAEIDKEYEKFK